MIIAAYGGKCVCCSIADNRILTIDHKFGNGRQNRIAFNYNSGKWFLWLRNNHFPDDYQLLCYNCNCGRFINGGICPHLAKRQAA